MITPKKRWLDWAFVVHSEHLATPKKEKAIFFCKRKICIMEKETTEVQVNFSHLPINLSVWIELVGAFNSIETNLDQYRLAIYIPNGLFQHAFPFCLLYI